MTEMCWVFAFQARRASWDDSHKGCCSSLWSQTDYCSGYCSTSESYVAVGEADVNTVGMTVVAATGWRGCSSTTTGEGGGGASVGVNCHSSGVSSCHCSRP